MNPVGVRRPGVVVAAATVLGALVVTADGDDGPVVCPYRRCTGGWCPGCGGTRATRALLTGDLDRAWAVHPGVVVLAVQLVVLAGVWALARPVTRRRLGDRVLVTVAIVDLVGALTLWAARLHTGSIPTGWF